MPHGALTCLDVSRRSLALAESRFPGEAEFVAFDGTRLPFEDGRFDLVFSACVHHHIPHEEHAALLAEWHRVLRPGGLAVIFEHNPRNPLTVRAVESCAFDENAVLVPAGLLRRKVAAAGFESVRRHYRVFFPRFLRLLRPLERLLTWLPIGAQYDVAARKPRAAQGTRGRS
jgi:SAM-dependent methyltransferase